MFIKKTDRKKAFTLLEIAVVITIIALIGGIALSASRDIIDNANVAATQNKLDVIEKALYNFWVKNGRMPCPSDITLASGNALYGVEVDNSGSPFDCTGGSPAVNFFAQTNENKAVEGGVPFVTLGLPREFNFDGWDRKIVYAVTPSFVLPYSNSAIPPKSGSCFVDTAIRIRDAGGSDRSISAVYALISYGNNGHGGYLATGSNRFNAGSTNSDEQTNCHCSSSAANTTYDGNYVQRSQNLNSTTPANYFDDIVRYKERWQLTTNEDVLNDDGYRGPDLAVGFVRAFGGAGTVYTYKSQCAAFIKQADLSPAPANPPIGVAFTKGNNHLLTYSASGCNLYKINANGTLTNLPSAFASACPYDATAVMELSNNGYLAISTSTSSAVIQLWKQFGDQFIALPSITHSAASVAGLSFSLDANLLAVRSATNTSRIYKRKGDSFSAAAADITQPPNLSTLNTPISIVFSPDGRYLADTERWTAQSLNYVNTWKVMSGNPTTFSQLTSFTPNTSGDPENLAFSEDSNYLIMDGSVVSTICPIGINDVFCNGSSLFLGYNRANDTVSSQLGSTTGLSYYAFSRNSNFALQTVSGTASRDVARRIAIDKFIDWNTPFQSNDTTGSTPVRPFSTILNLGSGGPVAFAN